MPDRSTPPEVNVRFDPDVSAGSSSISIRHFQTSDAEALAKLSSAVWPDIRLQSWNEPWTVLCRKRNRDDLIFVAERDGHLVGSVIVGYDGIRSWIYRLAVAPDQRRRGIGRRLLETAEATLGRLGCPKVNLQVRVGNPDVLAFYDRCGYVREERFSLGKRLPTSDSQAVPTIEVSETIRLSAISVQDRTAYLRHLNETDEIFARTASLPFPYTEFDVDQWLATVHRATIPDDGKINWAIRDEHSAFIGSVGLMNLKLGEKAEIGYWLAKPYWNRGIMTQVVRCLCSFAFEQLQLHRIHAKVFASNPGSARVLQKSGFTLEGRLRQHFYAAGNVGNAEDVLLFGLLRDGACATSA